MKRITLVASLFIATLALVSCGGENDPSSEESAVEEITDDKADATAVTVTMGMTTFSPGHISIKKGGTVIFTNPSAMAHTVTSGTNSSDPKAGATFDKTVKPGKTLKLKFKTAGAQNYFCRPHVQFGMKGVVTVTP